MNIQFKIELSPVKDIDKFQRLFYILDELSKFRGEIIMFEFELKIIKLVELQ